MKYAKKMTLVPIELMENMVKNSTLAAIENPNKEHLKKTLDSIQNLNDDNQLPDAIKANRLANKLGEASVMVDKINPRTPLNIEQDATTKIAEYGIHAIPKSYQRSAKALINELKNYPDQISWNEKTNEIVVNGERLSGSNLLDLVGDVVRPRKKTQYYSPLHSNKFLKLLTELNVAEEFVKNKASINKMRMYKKQKYHQQSKDSLAQNDIDDKDADEDDEEEEEEKITLPSASGKLKRKKVQIRALPYKRKPRYTWLKYDKTN